MPSPIQRIPPGLLDFLDARGTGRNPSEIEDAVRGVVDLTPFYQSLDLTSATVSASGVNAVGSAAVIGVPAGEVWTIQALALHLSAVTGPPGRIVLGMQIRTGTGQNLVPIGDTQLIATPALTTRWNYGVPLARGLVLGPGFTMEAVLLETLSAGTVTFSARAMFNRNTR